MTCWGACEHRHLGFRWSSLWGCEPCERVPKRPTGTHANTAECAFGGAPDGATHRVRGVPKQPDGAHTNTTTWAFGGAGIRTV